MKWQWQTIQKHLVAYRDHGVIAQDAVPVLQAWVEVQVSRFGADLDREEVSQELWFFMLSKLLPQLKTAKRIRKRGKNAWKPLGWHSWLLLSLRMEINNIRRRQLRHYRRRQPFREGDYGKD